MSLEALELQFHYPPGYILGSDRKRRIRSTDNSKSGTPFARCTAESPHSGLPLESIMESAVRP